MFVLSIGPADEHILTPVIDLATRMLLRTFYQEFFTIFFQHNTYSHIYVPITRKSMLLNNDIMLQFKKIKPTETVSGQLWN